MNRHIFSLILLLTATTCWSYDNLEIDLESGTTMNITRYQGEGKTLLMWLPSERGFGKGYVSVAMDLAILDYDVWAAQLHDSYVMPTGRQSLNEVDVEDLIELIEYAEKQGFEEIFLISSSRGVLLSLKTSYNYQKLHSGSDLLKGLVFFSPYLIKGRTEMGEDAEYEEIASFSNLPVYMLQPQYGTKFARSVEISNQLQQGGSPVYMHVLRETQAGFYMRPDDHLTERDIAMRDQLPQIINEAVNLLRSSVPAKFNTSFSLAQAGSDFKGRSIKAPKLHPFKGSKIAPALVLKNLQGQTSTLSDLKGSVVLVNFWATWCGPCVEEIPSLSRLVDSMKGKPFKVVAVNIGESAEDIKEFMKAIPVNFDIYQDTDGVAVRDWKVYAYPSNFLLDKNGQIQYAYRGALKWDAPSIIDTINSLLK
ncbi:MAG: TlpA family protein disulfide reductase [Thiotrichaceae bacterium]|nr:TlpA family protein disulfide reductase [Thiotrichaceae bacterium]